jgi:23S rRNA-/tRNA-specific pseudouridylate synthase
MHTTGVCLFIKREFRHLCTPVQEAFKAGQVRKEYLCLVDTVRGSSAEPLPSEIFVDAPVQRHPTEGILREIGATRPDSKPAYTVLHVLAQSEDNAVALLRAMPRTGR